MGLDAVANIDGDFFFWLDENMPWLLATVGIFAESVAARCLLGIVLTPFTKY